MRCNPWLGVTPLEIKGGPVEVNRTHTTVEMAHKYKLEHGKTEVTLSEEFKHHMALFSDEEANKFPPAQSNRDHKIILMDTAPTCFNCKTYLLLRDKQDMENKFINEIWKKATLYHWTLPMAFLLSWSLKRTQKRKGTLSTTTLESGHQKGHHPTPQP